MGHHRKFSTLGLTLGILFMFLVAVIVLLIVLWVAPHRRQERFLSAAEVTWPVQPRDYGAKHLAYPSKCFDCENAFPVGQKWRAQQTSCFSCEPVHPNKCFDCEKN
jgi:hypothetical protein